MTSVCHCCRSSISSLNDEAAKATKKLSEASKLLRKVREDLAAQINNLVNLTSLLHRGDEDLKNDLNTLRRHEMNSPLVREAIIAGNTLFNNFYLGECMDRGAVMECFLLQKHTVLFLSLHFTITFLEYSTRTVGLNVSLFTHM